MAGFVTRFAPSPTGYLHRGHAFSALTAHAAARAAQGRFLLRIEDIDATRCRPLFEAAIYDDLAAPIGMMKFAPIKPARGSLFSARRRLGLSGEPASAAPVPEEALT